ncbi:hypothetical protein PFISCL1PPCAC_21574, partial [Pristionchus fissidentatus]
LSEITEEHRLEHWREKGDILLAHMHLLSSDQKNYIREMIVRSGKVEANLRPNSGGLQDENAHFDGDFPVFDELLLGIEQHIPVVESAES